MTDEEILNKLEESTKDAARLQLKTLFSILERNGGVRYLQPYLSDYRAPVDAVSYRSAVPLSCYDDYTDHINKMADDRDDRDQPLLSVDPLVCFFYSSGTSSMKSKMIPYFDSAPSKAASFLAHQGSNAILRRLFPPRPTVNKILCFIYSGNVRRTKGGYKVMAASAFPLHSNNANSSVFNYCVSPREVILGSDVQHQMYCHLLCGLRNCDFVDGLHAPYAIGLIRAFSLLEFKWEQLCEDLEHGFPSSEISDLTMRDSVIKALGGPQPDLSKRIRSICGEKEWVGILGKLWPNARYIKCVSTGSMEQYYPKLKYYAGELPILGGDYFASECCVAMNLKIIQPPKLTRFVMLPSAAYFEFLPFELNKPNDADEETVDFSGVEVGKTYEVVITTFRGLYRCRLGDIVRIVGFHNSSPEIEFVSRAPKSRNEIFTERALMSAMESFQAELRIVTMTEVIDFTSFFDLDLKPKQLKIFVEVREGSIFLQEEKLKESVVVLKRCCSSLEDGLQGIYQSMRGRSELGPLLLFIVEPGTFDRLLQVAIKNGAPASQYKPPKIIRNREIADFLEGSSVVTVCLDPLDG
ncbi:probable indole-3-acetic acid-amido synthetase GH3.6 [Malania oleifera]|uniref:probable indole-3-acetic acid-amido synthetase GH3.6 n=1 Tax=Malania oleifera TaxID=397392 RepID=UPI0025AE9E32|nr:probable indole-3-acetic acid-amido synthetase GH3.6 [Malania oleifera]